MNMNKKIIGFLFAVVSVSFSCSFAMDFGPYAPNDPAVVEYYYTLFKQEEDKRRLEQEQARAQKEQQKIEVPSHDDQMRERAARHRKKLADLEKNGQVVVIAQQSDGQGVGDEVVGVENLLNDLTLNSPKNSIQGFVISTKTDETDEAEPQKRIKKRNQDSRPEADDRVPKRKPLPELLKEVLKLHEENEPMKEDREPVVVVIEQPLGQMLGQKRKNHDFSDSDSKRSKTD